MVQYLTQLASALSVTHAQGIGGDAVVGLRFDSSDVGDGLVEVVAYGTAVTL